MQRYRGAVDPCGGGLADGLIYAADGLVFDHVTSGGVLSGRQRAGEPCRQIWRNHCAAFGGQRRRLGEIEIALNQNFSAIRPDEQEIAALANEMLIMKLIFHLHR